MTLPILSLELRDDADVVTARQYSRQIAEALGLDGHEQTRMATAVSEIARNAFRYAGGGTIHFEVTGAPPQSLTVRIVDQGPGIGEPEVVLSGKFVSTTGQGMGIVGAQRLVDHFDLQTGPGGTTVTLAKHLPRPLASRPEAGRIASEVRHQAPARPLDELQRQNADLMDALAQLQERKDEIERLNYELAETNRGVLALNAELEDKADSLRKASDAKSRFLSHMSHELRTPLNSIRSLARILASRMDGPLTSEQERQVEFIRTSADALLELVNDLLDLGKIEAGKVDVQHSRFTVGSLFSAMRGMFRPLIADLPVTLTFQDVSELPPIVTDETKLSQIVRNFISNAVKYTEQGSVTVSAAVDGVDLRITVRDTGLGIAPESLPLIFEEFVQIRNPLQKRTKGSGIGLPLSMRLAQLLGGRIEVDSEPGRGSAFTVIIPSVLSLSDAAGQHDRRSARRVLIIDDAEIDRYTLRAILPPGCEVIETADGLSAIETVRSMRPAVIFLDLGMPDIEGTEVLRQLKADLATRDTRVIVYTSRPLSDGDSVRLRELGAHGVVQKGFTNIEAARSEIARVAGLEPESETATQ